MGPQHGCRTFFVEDKPIIGPMVAAVSIFTGTGWGPEPIVINGVMGPR